MSEQQQLQQTNSTFRRVCYHVQKMSTVQVLIGISILILFAYTVAMLITVDHTLKLHTDLSDTDFQEKYGISRIELHELWSLYTVVLIILTSMISIWVWTVLLKPSWKQALMGNTIVGLVMILFFFAVSISSYFQVSRKNFSNEITRFLNIATMFFTALILVLYGVAYVWNK